MTENIIPACQINQMIFIGLAGGIRLSLNSPCNRKYTNRVGYFDKTFLKSRYIAPHLLNERFPSLLLAKYLRKVSNIKVGIFQGAVEFAGGCHGVDVNALALESVSIRHP